MVMGTIWVQLCKMSVIFYNSVNNCIYAYTKIMGRGGYLLIAAFHILYYFFDFINNLVNFIKHFFDFARRIVVVVKMNYIIPHFQKIF